MRRIKKKVLLVSLCFYGLVSQAQTSMLPKGFSSGSIVCYVRAGVSLNGVTGDGVDDLKTEWIEQKINGDFKKTIGGSLTIGANIPIGVSPFYYGMSVSAAMRGYKTSEKIKNGTNKYEGQSKLTAFNAQLSPMNVGYIKKINNNVALDLHVGLFFSIDFAGSYSEEVNTSKNKISIDLSDIEDYSRYDAGFNGGIGLWFNHWGVDLSYHRGIASIYKNNDFCSTKIQLSLGYAF